MASEKQSKATVKNKRTNAQVSNDKRPSPASSFTIQLSRPRVVQLGKLAQDAGVTPEELLQKSVEGWLSTGEDFEEAAAYVLKKNAELYRRLA